MIFLQHLVYVYHSLLRDVRITAPVVIIKRHGASTGKEFTPKTLSSIISGLRANGIHRNLCIMGGEPLCPENLFLTHMIIKAVKDALPDTKVYIWTGYFYENLIKRKDGRTPQILELADVLIDGPYIQAERDITLPMRGSRNQRIINLREVYHEKA